MVYSVFFIKKYFDTLIELDRDVTVEEVAPILVEKLSKFLNVPVSKFENDNDNCERVFDGF